MPLYSNKKPLFTATKNLDVQYFFTNSEQGDMASVSLEGNNLHTNLTMGCTQSLHVRNSLKNNSGQNIYKKSLDDINFATMGITMLYSDTDTNEGYLGDDILSHYLDVQSPIVNQRVVSTMDFYSDVYQVPNIPANKAKRCHLFNQSLENRVSAFEKISKDYHYGSAIVTRKEIKQNVFSSRFHESYHHTEQTGLFYIEKDDYINLLLLELKKIDAALFYGFVIDIHTQRMMCQRFPLKYIFELIFCFINRTCF